MSAQHLGQGLAIRRRGPVSQQSFAAYGFCLALGISAVPTLADGLGANTVKGGTALSATGTLLGKLLEAGVECPQFQLETDIEGTSSGQTGSGEVISLTGAAPQDPGTYRLTGRWSRSSYCLQGRSFDVQTYALTDAK